VGLEAAAQQAGKRGYVGGRVKSKRGEGGVEDSKEVTTERIEEQRVFISPAGSAAY
jgi:hypothetical protein